MVGTLRFAHPTNWTRVRVPAARSARALQQHRPSRHEEGAGNTGCWPHPRALRAKENAFLRTQATTGQPEQPAFPAQWVTAYTWSPRCAGLSGHRRLALVTQGLIPASGDRDRTISPSAAHAPRRRAQSRPSHPAARFVTIGRNAPLAGRDGERQSHFSEKRKRFICGEGA
jgi:hypothetical protein